MKTFNTALRDCELVYGRISGGPVMALQKIEVRRHFRREPPWQWKVKGDKLLIGSLANVGDRQPID